MQKQMICSQFELPPIDILDAERRAPDSDRHVPHPFQNARDEGVADDDGARVVVGSEVEVAGGDRPGSSGGEGELPIHRVWG